MKRLFILPIFLAMTGTAFGQDAPAAQAPAADTPAAQAPVAQTPAGSARPAKGTKPAKANAGDTTDMFGLGNHNNNAPIDITSDNFDYDLNNKIGVYTGNVIVIQGDTRMRSERMKVNVAQGKPTRIEATGKVVVVAPNGTATGDVGVYELGPRTITMTGNVVLTKEKDVMRGNKLVMDMNSGLAHLTSPGERVHALFVPKQNSDAGTASGAKKPGKKSSKPAASGGSETTPNPGEK